MVSGLRQNGEYMNLSGENMGEYFARLDREEASGGDGDQESKAATTATTEPALSKIAKAEGKPGEELVRIRTAQEMLREYRDKQSKQAMLRMERPPVFQSDPPDETDAVEDSAAKADQPADVPADTAQAADQESASAAQAPEKTQQAGITPDNIVEKSEQMQVAIDAMKERVTASRTTDVMSGRQTVGAGFVEPLRAAVDTMKNVLAANGEQLQDSRDDIQARISHAESFLASVADGSLYDVGDKKGEEPTEPDGALPVPEKTPSTELSVAEKLARAEAWVTKQASQMDELKDKAKWIATQKVLKSLTHFIMANTENADDPELSQKVKQFRRDVLAPFAGKFLALTPEFKPTSTTVQPPAESATTGKVEKDPEPPEPAPGETEPTAPPPEGLTPTEALSAEQIQALSKLQTYATAVAAEFPAGMPITEIAAMRNEIKNRPEFIAALATLNEIKTAVSNKEVDAFTDDIDASGGDGLAVLKEFTRFSNQHILPTFNILDGIDRGNYPTSSGVDTSQDPTGEAGGEDPTDPSKGPDAGEPPSTAAVPDIENLAEPEDAAADTEAERAKESKPGRIPLWLVNIIGNPLKRALHDDGPTTIGFEPVDFFSFSALEVDELENDLAEMLSRYTEPIPPGARHLHKAIAPLFLALADKYIQEIDAAATPNEGKEAKLKLQEISQKIIDLQIRLPIYHNELRNVLSNRQILLAYPPESDELPDDEGLDVEDLPDVSPEDVDDDSFLEGEASKIDWGSAALTAFAYAAEKSKLFFPWLAKKRKALQDRRERTAQSNVVMPEIRVAGSAPENGAEVGSYQYFDQYIARVQNEFAQLESQELTTKNINAMRDTLNSLKTVVTWVGSDKNKNKFTDEEQQSLEMRTMKLQVDFDKLRAAFVEQNSDQTS